LLFALPDRFGGLRCLREPVSIIVSIHALVITALLTGCGRDQTKNTKNTAPIANENTLPPVNPNQYDVEHQPSLMTSSQAKMSICSPEVARQEFRI
jgi:hypothetical protein